MSDLDDGLGDDIALADDNDLDDELELRRMDALERGDVPTPSPNGERAAAGNVHDGNGDGRQLVIMGAREIAQLESEPTARWLVRPVWPADAYGVIAAEDKAGKTWSLLDLLVSIAYGAS